ncbi:hypothetical protein G9A89_016747 [Geosiphon pyriformis]|nr:hypothetical protein G9A89_016747 [Geosiphon pyriformis]
MTIAKLIPDQQTARVVPVVVNLNQPQPVVALPSIRQANDENEDVENSQQIRPKRSKKRRFYFEQDFQLDTVSPGKDGSRRRNRHNNNNFTQHPFAVLDPADLMPPGYENRLTTFHFVYDAVVDHLCMAFADGQLDPGSINLKKHRRQPEQMCKPCITREMRKRLKKSHPKGIVKKYEDELIYFLDRMNDDNNVDQPYSPTSVERHEEWVIVHEVKRGELIASNVDQEHDGVIVEKQADIVNMSTTDTPLSDEEEEKHVNFATPRGVFLVLDIGDKFSRWVVHLMCRYYNLWSFSKDIQEGKRLTYVCHPSCELEDIERGAIVRTGNKIRKEIKLPEKTFFEYLYV